MSTGKDDEFPSEVTFLPGNKTSQRVAPNWPELRMSFGQE
jgi:hypothetical protein